MEPSVKTQTERAKKPVLGEICTPENGPSPTVSGNLQLVDGSEHISGSGKSKVSQS